MSEAKEGTLVTPSIRLVRELGKGGMGSIWIADHLTLRTQVVVKFIAEGLSKDAASLARFSREAAAASQVKSPHVVQMLDHGVDGAGVPFIVMELLDGEDLAARMNRVGRMDKRDVAQIIVQTSRALSRAHEKGIIHRDIKPENIFLCDLGGGEIFVKVLDFGIARSNDAQLATTGTGQMIGTPYYMSPEQIMGKKELDHRTDLWALGVVGYQMLTGARPFDGDTVGALAIAIHSAPLPMPRAIVPTLPAAVDEWFAKACARPAAERYQTAREFASGFCGALGVMIEGVPASRDASSSGAVRLEDARAATPAALDRTAVVGSGAIPPDTGVAASVGVDGRPLATRSKKGIVIGGALAAALITGGVVVLATGGADKKTTSEGAASSAHETKATATPTQTATETTKVAAPIAPPPTQTTPIPTPTLTQKPAVAGKVKPIVAPKPSASVTSVPTKPKNGYDDIQ